MGKSRTAIDTIKGYYYQFDYYILKLLECQNDNDRVSIEGIEDVDLQTEDESIAIQCKYYAKTEYNHSVIAKPLRYMFDHFLTNTNNGLQYKIYGHYQSGQEKLDAIISVDFFKTHFMTLKAFDNLSITDGQIQLFLNVLKINNNAPEFEQQESFIIDKLKTHFNCTEFEALHFYYNNALRVVKDLSIKSNLNERTISKSNFIAQVNNKDLLFNLWFLKKKGLASYCSSIRKEYFTKTNISPSERFFLIECDNQITDAEIKILVQKISKGWSRLSSRESNSFCPYCYLHNITPQRITNILKLLQSDNFILIDGYDFKNADFSHQSINKKANHNNQIKLKFIHETNHINSILENINNTREIYQFCIQEKFYTQEKHLHKIIQIAHTKNINDII